MADPPDPRVYSQDEISTILRRASELQSANGIRPGTGLTLEELQQLARDADIDPSFVVAAAFELTRGDDPAARTFMGGPLTLSLRREIPGRVSDEAFGHMVTAARRHFSQSGQTSEVGSTREWSAITPGSASSSFSLIQREFVTEIEVFWNEGILAVPFILVPIMICLASLGVVFGALESGWIGIPIYLGWATTIAALARYAFAATAARERQGVAGFIDQLVLIAREDPARPPGRVGSARQLQEPAPPGFDGPDREAWLVRKDRVR